MTMIRTILCHSTVIALGLALNVGSMLNPLFAAPASAPAAMPAPQQAQTPPSSAGSEAIQPPAADKAADEAADGAQEITIELPAPTNLTEALLLEIETLQMELAKSREELAQSRLDAQATTRELEELRNFVVDHDRFGDDFKQYKAVKEAADREARAQELEKAKAQRAVEKAERDARRAAARSQVAMRNAESDRLGKYRRLGFTPLGLDVFGGKMAFFYNTKTSAGTGPLVNYDSLIGNYLQPGIPPQSEIDYSQMTISGSVLNATDVIRNIGVAITFFDDNGNQVGHETVQIENARPDVPYPFTSKIEMALNRAFASSSTYVLYADAVGE